METSAQEELVTMIFGSSPPEGWEDSPDFQLYLSELGSLSPDRIASEPERVAEELTGVQSYTQELAFSNYKTFIQTSACSKEIFSSFTDTEAHLSELLVKLPNFQTQCQEFQARAQDIGSHRRLTSLTLAKHTNLLEVLELPQLMETVVRNGHYEEALELQSYVTRLVKKQPRVQILQDISKAISQSIKLMLQQLLSQLRAPVQLPQCLKVISFLRRLDVFGESEIRLKFLQCRETWLDSVVAGVPKEDPGTHLTRTMELVRVHLFDIVTQYRAIFSEESSVGDAQDNRLLFTSWLSRKITQFLEIVKTDLEQGVSSTESILGQAMYFGLSFSRVGFDFRPLLAPLFLTAVENQFQAALHPSSCLSSLSIHLSSFVLSRVSSPSPLQSQDPSSPPLSLMEFSPLAHLANSILGALNELRLCAPLSLAPCVTSTIQKLLQNSTKQILDWHSALSPNWSQEDRVGYRHLCNAVAVLLLPHLQACLSAIFPAEQLSLISGLPREQLLTNGCGFLNTKAILEPLESFLPVTEQVLVGSSETTKTEFVADRMKEITEALDSTRISEELKDSQKVPIVEVVPETKDNVVLEETTKKHNTENLEENVE